MKLGTAITLIVSSVGVANAFAPAAKFGIASPKLATTVRPLSLDSFTSFSLSDAVEALPDPSDIANAVQQVATSDAVSDVAEAATTSDNGWFGFLTLPIQAFLELLHTGLVGVGMNQDAWGISIIALTIIIKFVTFPLTKSQLESTNKMQALQPQMKALQDKYQSNPEVMNQKIAELYQTNQVNPLAGCIPSLVQLPIFIGLYRAVLDLAKENKLDEPFLFLPNLEGPTYGADPASGSDWLFKWVDGAPPLGWDDTTSFLILPVLLVVSQLVSMQLMQPKDQPQQNNFILQILPIMIGWFSLNVPAALCLYWVTNNIVTTATTLWIRNSMDLEPATVSTSSSSSSSATTVEPIFAPPPSKPAGFGSPTTERAVDDVKPITASAVDAEIVESVTEGESDDEDEKASSSDAPKSSKKKRGKKGKKN